MRLLLLPSPAGGGLVDADLHLLCSPDQPEDGPQLFILLFGFYSPHLIAALDEVGVHVSVVLRLCSEVLGEEELSEDEADSQTAGEGATAPLAVGGVVAASWFSWRLPEAKADLAGKLNLFWSDLAHVWSGGSAKSRLPDVVQLSYTVQVQSQEAKVSRSPQPPSPPLGRRRLLTSAFFQLETGIRTYGAVANLLYDCLAKRRQHQHYLQSIRLINVPAVTRLPPPLAEVHILELNLSESFHLKTKA